MESIQVYDGGNSLPPEIVAIIEENKELKEKIIGLEDTIKRLQRKIRFDKSDDSREILEKGGWVSWNPDFNYPEKVRLNDNGH